jgi:DNA-binding FadR family transcriptional regulator
MNSNVFRSDRVKADISHGEILKAIMSGSLNKTEELIRKHIIDTGIWLEEKKKEISKRE